MFVKFLKTLEKKDTTIFQEYPQLNEHLIRSEVRRIHGFICVIVGEFDRMEDRISGTFSKN